MGKLAVTYLAAAAVALTGCSMAGSGTGRVLYDRNCADCHGVAGAGDGELARDLPVAPADLRGLAARNGGVFPVEYVMATIHGYRGKDHDGLMPAFGDELDGPETLWIAPDGRQIPTPAALVALAEYVETLQDG